MSDKKLIKSYYAIVETSARTKVLDELAIYEEQTDNDTYCSAIIEQYDDTDGDELGPAYDKAKAYFDANFANAKVYPVKDSDEYDVTFWTISHFNEYVDADGNELAETEDIDVSEFPE